jgi:hypothetical protein
MGANSNPTESSSSTSTAEHQAQEDQRDQPWKKLLQSLNEGTIDPEADYMLSDQLSNGKCTKCRSGGCAGSCDTVAG